MVIGMTQREVAAALGLAPEELQGGLNLVVAARLLGIAPSTLRQRALAGKIGYQRDGRAWRFFHWHLAAYLQSREHPARGGNGLLNRALAGQANTDDVMAEAVALGLIEAPEGRE